MKLHELYEAPTSLEEDYVFPGFKDWDTLKESIDSTDDIIFPRGLSREERKAFRLKALEQK